MGAFGGKPSPAALRDQGYALLERGDVVAASTLCEESLAAARDVEDAKAIAWSCLDLALVRLHQQDWDGAQALLLDSVSAGDARPDANIDDARIPFCLAGLARVAAARGNHERAIRLFSASQALRPDWWSGKTTPHSGEMLPTNFWSGPPFDAESVDEWLSPGRAKLGVEPLDVVGGLAYSRRRRALVLHRHS